MFQVYIFFLVLCGGLALLSVLGDFLDTDVAESDAGLDFDADAGIEVEADLDLDAGADGGVRGSAVDAEKIFSIRGALYAGFGFGLVGTLLTLFGSPAGSPATIGFAAVTGLGAGWLVTRLLNWIRNSETGAYASDRTYEGRMGRMTLPITKESSGRVRIRRGDRTHDLRALPHPSAASSAPPDDWRDVMVIEVRDGVALVAPVESDELQLES